METFLRRLFRFGVIFGAFLVGARALNQLLLRQHAPRWPADVHVLVAGDSHIANAIDPELLGGAVAVPQHSETFAATYAKVSWLLEHNPTVEVVVVGAAPHNFGRYLDMDLAEDDVVGLYVSRYYGLLDWREIGGGEIAWPAVATGTMRQLWLPNAHLLGDLAASLLGRSRRHDFIGGFVPHDTPGPPRDEALAYVQSRHFARDAEGAVVSAEQTRWLHRLVELTSEAGVRLVLLSTPVDPDYVELVPDDLRAHFYRQMALAAGRPGVEFWDYERWTTDPEVFWDPNHLSRAGAVRFSRRLAERLTRLSE